MWGVKVGEHYFLKSNAHVDNEKLYFAKGSKIVLQQVTHGAIQFFDKRKKIVQFALIFHLLSHDYLMTKYTTMETLFVYLNLFKNSIKHWSNGYRWEMLNCMSEQVLKQIQTTIVRASFLCFNAYEVTTIDN